MTLERYRYQRYLLMTLDPVHPGAGGHRLGRVDNSIAREPGTRLPKIPGSSLHGAARSYAAYLYGTPEAAGQSQEKVNEPEKNPICYTFGYIKGKKMSSGVINLFDAHLLLFPVHSMRGPVWVSTAARLQDAGIEVGKEPQKAEEILATWKPAGNERLNLGWLMLGVAEQAQVRIEPPVKWKEGKTDQGGSNPWETVKDRIVIVSEDLFPQIVNSNLEVRTSVAINPETGAAEEGALYTYEAIPRATFLSVEVMLDDYPQKFPQNERWNNPLEVVQSGLKTIEYLGVGGMGTRGFGRIKLLGTLMEKTQDEIFQSVSQEAQA